MRDTRPPAYDLSHMGRWAAGVRAHFTLFIGWENIICRPIQNNGLPESLIQLPFR
jgi:hypothetical protein